MERHYVFLSMNKMVSVKFFKSAIAISLYSVLAFYMITRIALANSGLIEAIYTSAFYPPIAGLLAAFSNLFPFSIDDVLYAALIVFLLVNVFMFLLRRLSFVGLLSRFVVTGALLYACFNLLWGFNYYRQNINERLGWQHAKADVHELMQAFKYLVDKTNETYTPIYSIDKNDLLKQVQVGYIQQATFLNIDTALLLTSPKSITLSRLFGAATISGYYGPFFSEIHLNDYLLPMDYPQVLAHEMAHKLGVTSEAEANFYAWLVCSHSDDKRLAYSANLHLLKYFVYECYQHEGYHDVVKTIRYEARHDFYKSHYHWMSLMNRHVEIVASKVNDAYLKSNHVEAGIEDYDGVVKHVMDYLLFEQESR